MLGKTGRHPDLLYDPRRQSAIDRVVIDDKHSCHSAKPPQKDDAKSLRTGTETSVVFRPAKELPFAKRKATMQPWLIRRS
jgi:hypothetical protein